MKRSSYLLPFVGLLTLFTALVNYAGAEERASIYEQLQNDRTAGIQTFSIPSEGGTISIFVRVLDGQTRLPVQIFSGSYVLDKAGYYHDFGDNSKDGITEICCLLNDVYKFRASARGYENDVQTINIAGLGSSLKWDHSSPSASESAFNASMNFRKQKPSALTFVLYPAKGRAGGRVINSLTKEPIEGAEVNVEQDGEYIPVLTNNKGVFQVEGLRQLPENDSTGFSVSKNGYVTQERHYVKKGLSEKNLEFALIPMGGIEGVLYDYSGKPAVKRQIYLSTKSNFESIKRSIRFVKHYENSVFTDSNGSFEFENVKAGEYVLLYGPDNADIQEVTVNAAESKNITLKQHSQGNP